MRATGKRVFRRRVAPHFMADNFIRDDGSPAMLVGTSKRLWGVADIVAVIEKSTVR